MGRGRWISSLDELLDEYEAFQEGEGEEEEEEDVPGRRRKRRRRSASAEDVLVMLDFWMTMEALKLSRRRRVDYAR